MKKLVFLFAALALVAAACGGGEGDPAALPINDGADAGASADTTCVVDEPDCDDTPGGEPTDLPPPGNGGDEPPPASSPISSAADMTGPVAVTGFIVAVDTNPAALERARGLGADLIASLLQSLELESPMSIRTGVCLAPAPRAKLLEEDHGLGDGSPIGSP